MSKFWDKRLKLLEAIKKNGNRVALRVLNKNIYASGRSLTKVINEFESKGFITKEEYENKIKTNVTEKGEKLMGILRELEGVMSDED